MSPSSDWIRVHLGAPHGVGELPAPAGRGVAENPACGDVLHLWVGRDAAGRARLRFRARACSAVIATASLLCERFEGAELADLRAADVAGLVADAGGVPPAKTHAPKVVARALAEALTRL